MVQRVNVMTAQKDLFQIQNNYIVLNLSMVHHRMLHQHHQLMFQLLSLLVENAQATSI